MTKERKTSISGWHIIHDFFYGWGLMEPNRKRTIWGRELDKNGLDFYTSTLEEIEAVWPVVQDAREKEAVRIAKLPKPKFNSFTFPNIKGSPQFDTSPISDILSVQPMAEESKKGMALLLRKQMMKQRRADAKERRKKEEDSDG